MKRNGVVTIDASRLPMGVKSDHNSKWPFDNMAQGDMWAVVDSYVASFVQAALGSYKGTVDCRSLRKKFNTQKYILAETGEKIIVIERTQ